MKSSESQHIEVFSNPCPSKNPVAHLPSLFFKSGTSAPSLENIRENVTHDDT